ncbi:MAG: uroporphyrinogen decarboxylase [Acidimicrobiales bacterium]
MRQAGRSLPEYRAKRGAGSILDAITHAELAAELTIQPVRRYGVDAAILFSDITVPVWASGFGIEVLSGRGPVVNEPFKSRADLQRIRPIDAESETGYVAEAAAIVAKELGPKVPLIGFAGAPFTVASYLVEGGASKDFARVKALMHTEPRTWHDLAGRLATLATGSLAAQVRAGASAVQLFDSWAGVLSPGDYERFVLPTTTQILAAVKEMGVPSIIFGVGAGELLGLMASAGPDVVGVDWRVPLGQAHERVGNLALQGNLDPALCLAPFEVAARATRDILAQGASVPGHVFNLGHGVLPDTDPGVLKALVELVHSEQTAGER